MINNRYQLIRIVGRGSFGEVWLAKDLTTGIEVAIKIYIALDEKGVQEFKEEFLLTYSLNHPNLLHTNYFDISDNRPYLVMPYCPNSASGLIGTKDEKAIWRFIRDTAAGLEYLHSQDIVHRDIKPDNILADSKGNFLISDFGISLKMKSTLRKNSKLDNGADNSSGTVAYMGPEMFTAHPNAVKATDIWALGATIFEIAEGELPFCGQGGVMVLHGADSPEIPDDWSYNLRGLILSCLQKNTWDRPTAELIKLYANDVIEGRKDPWNKATTFSLTSQNHEESNDNYRLLIERNLSNGNLREAYDLCLELMYKGTDKEWVQSKMNVIVPLLKRTRKKEDKKNIIWAILVMIVSIIVGILFGYYG